MAEAARRWEIDFYQLDAGGFKGEMIQVMTGAGMVGQSRFMGGVEQRGAVPAGFRTFGIPLPDCTPFRWRGRLLDANHLLMFPKSGELDSRSFAGFHVHPVSIPEPLLAKLAVKSHYDWFFDGGERVVCCGQGVIRALRAVAASVISVSSRSEDPGAGKIAGDLMMELSEGLMAALDGGRTAPVRPMAQLRRRALKDSLEIIRSPENRVWRVAELCEEVGVSRRTLQYAFEEEFQVSPKQYLQARRLMAAKRRLETAGPGAQVGQIASQLGFWHMGQFAADFGSHFGKRPSDVISKF
ncbi:MAG: helix-turn-helix domain-containing protein [Haloferula sp.]